MMRFIPVVLLVVAISMVSAQDSVSPASDYEFSGEEIAAFANVVSDVVGNVLEDQISPNLIMNEIQKIEDVVRDANDLALNDIESFSRGHSSVFDSLIFKFGKLFLPKAKLSHIKPKPFVPISEYSGYAVTANGYDKWIVYRPDNQGFPTSFFVNCLEDGDTYPLVKVKHIWMTSTGRVFLSGKINLGNGDVRGICTTNFPWSTYNCNQIPEYDSNTRKVKNFIVLENYPVFGTDTAVMATTYGMCMAETPFSDNMTDEDNCFPLVQADYSIVRALDFWRGVGVPKIYAGTESAGPGVCVFDLPSLNDFPIVVTISECIPNNQGTDDGVHFVYVTKDRIYAREFFRVKLLTAHRSDFTNGWEGEAGITADEMVVFQKAPMNLYTNDQFIGQCTIHADLDGNLDDEESTMTCDPTFIPMSSRTGHIKGRSTKLGDILYSTTKEKGAFSWWSTKLGSSTRLTAPYRGTFNCDQSMGSIRDLYVVP